MSLPSHRRSRSSAYLSWDNGYKRTWALLFSSDWETILPACRRHLVKEKNFKHKHPPPTPRRTWRPSKQFWKVNGTGHGVHYYVAAPRSKWSSPVRSCQASWWARTGRLRNLGSSMARTAKCSPCSRSLCYLYVHLLLRRQMHPTCTVQLSSWVFSFFAITDVCSSLHTLQFTSNYPNVRENIKCIILNTVRQASCLPFSANLMEHLDSLSSYLIIISF